MPNQNNVYAELFASVTAFNVTTITSAMTQLKGQEERALKTRIFKLGKQFAKAIEWYGSEDGQIQMDESGAHFNDVDQFCKALCGKGKSWVYKGRKAFLYCEANESAFEDFLLYIKTSAEAELSEFTQMSVEHFNKWVSNDCPAVYELTEQDENERAESEAPTNFEISLDEPVTEEGESGDGTQFSFSCKNSETLAGGCIRMDRDYGIIAEDGNADAIKVAMVSYLLLQGYNVVPRS
jgi:hypothetical protein